MAAENEFSNGAMIRRRDTHLFSKRSKSCRILTRMAAALWTRLGLLALLECVEDLACRLSGQIFLCTTEYISLPTLEYEKGATHVEIIPDHDHWCVTARALALDLDDRELAVLGRLAGLDATQVTADGVQDLVRTTKHAGGGGADLDKVLANGLAVEHGVEGGDLVDTHGGHLEEIGDVVHDGYGRPSFVLTLAEVEERDDGGFLVLRGVVGDDFLGTLEVLGGELEGDLGGVRICRE